MKIRYSKKLWMWFITTYRCGDRCGNFNEMTTACLKKLEEKCLEGFGTWVEAQMLKDIDVELKIRTLQEKRNKKIKDLLD